MNRKLRKLKLPSEKKRKKHLHMKSSPKHYRKPQADGAEAETKESGGLDPKMLEKLARFYRFTVIFKALCWFYCLLMVLLLWFYFYCLALFILIYFYCFAWFVVLLLLMVLALFQFLVIYSFRALSGSCFY